MTLSQTPTQGDPVYHRFYRVGLAVCILLAPLVVFLGFAFDPTGGVPPPPDKIFVAYQAASPLKIQLFLFFNAITPYFFPLSFIGLALLAVKRAPWLANIGMILGLIGTLPFGFFVWPEALGDAMTRTGGLSTFITVWNGVSSEGIIIFLQYSWVAGHLLGYLLLGIAFIRARSIPLWAAILLLLALPFQAAAYMAHQGIFQLLSYLLIFIASIPAALAMLQRPNQETLLAENEAKGA